jgi:microcystin-dependent protein
MAALNFPPFSANDPNPSNGDVWTAPNGTQWEYDINIPAWKALAKPGPGVVYRGGIDLTLDPNSQYQQIVSGNFFVITVGANPANNAFYPGLGGLDAEEGNEIIYDGTEWQFITVQIPYATTTVAGKVELATAAEAEAGVNSETVLTPATGQLLVPQATTTVVGKTRYATKTEAELGSITDAALTPSSIANLLQLIADNKANQVPVGMIMWFTGNNAPGGWTVCDGGRIYDSGLTRDLYRFLKQVGGKPWSNGDIVKVPDLRGRFIRANNLGTNRDPANPSLGEAQDDQLQQHLHSIDDPGHDHNFEGYSVDLDNNESNRAIMDDKRNRTTLSDGLAVRPAKTGINKTKNTGGAETRPKNLNLLPCIKL